MASSGSFKTNGVTGSGCTISFTFSWQEVSQSVENNSTTISYKVVATVSPSGYYRTAYARKLVINGVTIANVNGSSSNGVRINNNTTLFSGQVTIAHNSDGTKSFSANLGVSIGTYGTTSYNCNGSGSWSLDQIARASDFTLSGSQLGSTVTVTIDRKSSSFTHLVEYSFQGSSWTTASSAATTSASFVPPLSLGSQIPNNTSGTLSVRVTTKNGSTTIGSSVTKTITLSLPSSVIPSTPSISLVRQDNGVPSGWGVYVKGYSKVQVNASSSGSYGSSIRSYSVNCDGLGGSNGSVFGPFSTANTKTVTVVVTDSRGRTNSNTATFTVLDYFEPSISVTANRCNSSGNATPDGTYLYVTCNFNYASVGGKNTVSVTVSCNGASQNPTSSGSFILAANVSPTNPYVLTATISDGMGKSASVEFNIPTDVVPLSIKLNKKGIAIGGYSTEDNVFQVFWTIKDFNGREIDGGAFAYVLSVTDSYVEIGNEEEWVARGRPRGLL